MSELSILLVIICCVITIIMAWGWALFTDFETHVTELLAVFTAFSYSVIIIWCLTFFR